MSAPCNRKGDEVHMCSCCLIVGLKEAAMLLQVENSPVFWQFSQTSVQLMYNAMFYLIQSV